MRERERLGVLERLVTDRKLLLGTVVLILLLATFVRFYHIEWSFSNNGLDEGIMIERARLVGDGYALYTDLPCDQAPLAFYLGAPFGGDVVSLRSLSAAISILAIVAVMEAARRVRGNLAMIAAGLLISFDFAFLRESRLFSLDGISSSFLAFALLAFVMHLQKRSRMMLTAAGFLVGLSAAAKLFGVLGLLGMIVFIFVEARRDKGSHRVTLVDAALLIIASAIPLAAFMFYLGPGDMTQGMVFNQGQRSFEPWLKLSLVAYFGLNLAYVLPLVYAKKTWSMGKETRFLLCVSVVILAFMVFQPLVFFHHLPIMSPSLAILGGAFVSESLGIKKETTDRLAPVVLTKKWNRVPTYAMALLCLTVLVSGGLAGYGLAVQEEPPQEHMSDDLEGMTKPEAWIVAGDPLICAYADRSIPPGVVNVAYRQHPDLTLDDIERAIVDYNVTVVVLSGRLLQMDGINELLREYNFTVLLPRQYPMWKASWVDYHAALDFFQDDMGPVFILWRGTESGVPFP
ncbi:MAG TPA: glycosyltransferase family 39 protein [Thermoplasmata archaeon]|nr:glycosyltransferase family 39 protein [Thermoplasmata archaeon]